MKRNRMKLMIMMILFSIFLGGCAGCGGCKEQPQTAATQVPVHTPTLSIEEPAIVTKEPTVAPTITEVPTATMLPTATPTETVSPTTMTTPTVTPTPSPTPTPTVSPTPVPTMTATPPVTLAPTATVISVPTASPVPTPTSTPVPKPTNTPTPKPTASPTPTPVMINGIGVGDYVTFGRYEQDNILENGPEPIEWLVLDVKDGKAFLLARYGLDQHSYHVRSWMSDDPNSPDFDRPVEVTWETCEMRSWLNTTFMDAAFSLEEQEDIVATKITNPDGKHGTDGGNDTVDMVYLLSGEESRKYLGQEVYVDKVIGYKNDKAYTTPTVYAEAQGVEAWKHNRWYDGNCEWWLRTPGQGTNWAGMIGYDGGYNMGGRYVTGGLAVRPVTWVDLESECVGKVN